MHCFRSGVVALLLMLLGASCVLGDDNILGLPKPDDPQKPGALVLHGGGKVTDDLFDRFIELAGGKQAKIVFVPSAGYRVGDYRNEAELLLNFE